MKGYFIQEHLGRENFHGGVGNVDAEKIFLRKGFTAIAFPCQYEFSLKAKWLRCLFLIKTLRSLPHGSIVFFQFPLYARLNRILVSLLVRQRKLQVVCFLTDIDGIKDGDSAVLKSEIRRLRQYDYCIVHNEVMKQWLESVAHPKAVTVIDFFDFLAEPVTITRSLSTEVVFAGNLLKSRFLLDLADVQSVSPRVIFNIYGVEPPGQLLPQANVRYKGFKEPYELPAALEGSFGLVWDGDSIAGRAGSLGDYMQYISHHKSSLYILTGLPLIACAGTATAIAVEKYKIGIVVNNLMELQRAIEAVTPEQYGQMVANQRKLAMMIAGGEMLTNAIDALLALMHGGRSL